MRAPAAPWVLLCAGLLASLRPAAAAFHDFPKNVPIGALFDDFKSQEETMFLHGVKNVSDTNNMFNIIPGTEPVRGDSQLLVSLEVCKLVSTGVWAVFGPQKSQGSSIVQSMCDTMDIPHVQTRFDAYQRRTDILVNLFPHPSALGQVLVDIVIAFKWRSFTIIYEDDDGLTRVTPLLSVHQVMQESHKKPVSHKLYTITLRRLSEDHDNRQATFHDVSERKLLREIKNSGDTDFIIDCNIRRLPEVLTQAQQVGLMVAENRFIISNLDMYTIDMMPYSYGGSNITGIRLIDPDEVHASLANTDMAGEVFLTETAVQGFSGKILFDNEGFRSNIELDIIEVVMDKGIQKVGTWNTTLGLNLTRVSPDVESGSESLMNRTFIVLIALTNPYGMRKEKTIQLRGNDRYEGYGVDIINDLSMMLGFNYTLEVQHDNKYGSRDPKTGEWNGMLRRIMDNEADLAITDLTITAERESAVDFTMPFMSTGISILYKAPTKAPPKLFSFMDPFSIDVWIVMFFAYIGVSLLLFLMGRICPYEWTNPYPCIDDPDELINQFSFKNSLWFTIGSLMQQGSDIAPIAVSTRMVAGIWWFFTLIMVSSYTANLAAFLTVESLSQPFQTAYDLVDQDVIQYGAKSGGSTVNFFKDSPEEPFQRMFRYMNNTPGLLPSSNEEGLDKVKNENYAFFMESAAIEFIVERHCEVKQYGGLLDSKGYGIAMKKGAPYRNALSAAVLKLQESGRLMALKDKWWKEERGGGVCASQDTGGGTAGLQLENVGGVFVVLVAGVILAVFMTLIELIWSVCTTSIKEKVSFRQELKEELKFISKFHGSTKPVRKYNQEEEEQEEDNMPYPYGFIEGQQQKDTNHHVS
ncbi:Glutamate [NMDA] receptor subunit 1 [Gryllus bimaculatus]|nr:Glutamate [NMDA] receptor subunit 1 [Gryllus bimaculatus]